MVSKKDLTGFSPGKSKHTAVAVAVASAEKCPIKGCPNLCLKSEGSFLPKASAMAACERCRLQDGLVMDTNRHHSGGGKAVDPSRRRCLHRHHVNNRFLRRHSTPETCCCDHPSYIPSDHKGKLTNHRTIIIVMAILSTYNKANRVLCWFMVSRIFGSFMFYVEFD